MSNNTMQCVQHTEGDMQGGLALVSGNVPAFSASQVLVKVAAFGINRADLLQRAGRYPAPEGESPVLGLEVSGVIEAIGDSVEGWLTGQRVCAIVAGGGYAEYVAIEASHLIAIPDNMSDTQAAGLSEVFLTAYQALKWVGEINPGNKALIHAGASGVGLAALQLCRLWDVSTATTASSTKKLNVCKDAGAKLLINYKEQDFAAEIKSKWPDGVDMVLDMVAGDYLNRNLKILAMDGNVVYLAMLAGRFADKLDMGLLLGKRATVRGTTLRNRDNQYKARLVKDFCRDCLPALTKGSLTVPVDTVYAVADINQAHQQVLANDTCGKVIVCWS
ncbi:MAG: NAD(P)H-quinone oxidoreductase [Alteromonadaceae bacterium]|nr:NAD(P)H-quinone oxidoreductase [Alteromonadaceae bacterium]